MTSRQNTLRVYLVEDNFFIRHNLIATLEDLAGIVVSGWTGAAQEAVDWLTQDSAAWNLAIVDVFLMQGSGLEVLAACRNRQAHQKIIVLSNYASADARARYKTLGADASFDKSTEIEALLSYCKQLRTACAAG